MINLTDGMLRIMQPLSTCLIPLIEIDFILLHQTEEKLFSLKSNNSMPDLI